MDPQRNVQPAPLVQELRARCCQNNAALLQSLREDTHSKELFEAVVADERLGRMTSPVLAKSLDLGSVRLAPRFAIEQMKDDGSLAIRPIDNFSWSEQRAPASDGRSKQRRQMKEGSVNGFSTVCEKIRHDHLDDLLAMQTCALERSGHVFGLFKADVDSAYRRVPVRVEDLWACYIVFLYQAQASRVSVSWSVTPVVLWQAWASMHRCCPFGATSAVYAWERVGALLAHIGRKCLKLALCRYVDDYFGCERCVLCSP